MSAYESYEAEEMDFSESFDTTDELALPSFLRPGRKVSVPGTGLVSATLNTPKGPARLSLPTAVPTQVQFRQLESALNASNVRLNAVQTELAKMRRELLLRRQGPGSSNMMSMLLPLIMQKKLKEDLVGHTHGTSTDPAVIKDSGDSFSTLLPLLFLMPGMMGGSSTTASTSKEPDLFSNPLVMMILFDAL